MASTMMEAIRNKLEQSDKSGSCKQRIARAAILWWARQGVKCCALFSFVVAVDDSRELSNFPMTHCVFFDETDARNAHPHCSNAT